MDEKPYARKSQTGLKLYQSLQNSKISSNLKYSTRIKKEPHWLFFNSFFELICRSVITMKKLTLCHIEFLSSAEGVADVLVVREPYTQGL